MISNVFLLIFALAFMGCVLATPLVTRIAGWAGAIDRPDQFRRIHKGAIPRLGGLGLAFGLALSVLPILAGGYLREWQIDFPSWWGRQFYVVAAGAIILIVGVIDDTRGLKARYKLLGQAAAVLVLFVGGIRIDGLVLLGIRVPLSFPMIVPVAGYEVPIDLPSLFVTLLWFLGCMNIWNLIDGMDGLASGVGLLVSSTLMLVAIHEGNYGSAAIAAALAGSLAGFLLYNWHPACIFLGDSGSLMIGLLIGVIGVQDSLKGTTAVSILFPLLAMGLPISDTVLAIFRRWVRNLPLSSADRRHIHHLLIGLGLNPRQASLLLYSFTSFLCGAVLIGVAFRNEFLALILGVSGCVAFLLILTSRRDELATLRSDLKAKRDRKIQEKIAARQTWEAIQRIELCESPQRIWDTLLDAATNLGSDRLRLVCTRKGQKFLAFSTEAEEIDFGSSPDVSGSTATFRLPSGHDMELVVSLHQAPHASLPADIAFRSLQRLALATAQRLERLFEDETREPEPHPTKVKVNEAEEIATPMLSLARTAMPWGSFDWLKSALGRGDAAGPHI
jgi:UDP-GlcNAc:undecaprenyl-phosphate GlcNAc-1-phosphate transferase